MNINQYGPGFLYIYVYMYNPQIDLKMILAHDPFKTPRQMHFPFHITFVSRYFPVASPL